MRLVERDELGRCEPAQCLVGSRRCTPASSGTCSWPQSIGGELLWSRSRTVRRLSWCVRDAVSSMDARVCSARAHGEHLPRYAETTSATRRATELVREVRNGARIVYDRCIGSTVAREASVTVREPQVHMKSRQVRADAFPHLDGHFRFGNPIHSRKMRCREEVRATPSMFPVVAG